MTFRLCTVIFVLSILISCKSSGDNKEIEVSVNVNLRKVYQRIEGFGASDCWTVQFVGKNWPVEKREAIADLLFSKEMDKNGNPMGIALSHWRFNIGAGTAEQGKNSEIPSSWRRVECFLNSDGTYDWTKQAGQQWFLKAAKDRGVDKLLAFNNSAPVYYTNNGKGWSPGGSSYNLRQDKYEDYARFLMRVYEHFENKGLGFDYVSQFNEPQWDWKAPATQEGSPAHNQDIAKLVRELSPMLVNTLPKSKIVIPEAAQLQFLYRKEDRSLDRDDQIDAFFKVSQPTYLNNLPNLQQAVLGHSYFTTNDLDTLMRVRKHLNHVLKANYPFLEYWQSEYCILENHKDIGDGNHRDLGMTTALYVARIIHSDLVFGNASLWAWWTALTAVDYKDGLIYIDRGGTDPFRRTKVDSLQFDGDYHDSKLLWTLGNYSRFIRPDMYRFDVDLDSDLSPKKQMEDLMISGFKTKDDEKLVFVAINYSTKEKDLCFQNFLESVKDKYSDIRQYTTSDSQNMECKRVNGNSFFIPAKSVVTLVLKCNVK